MSQNDKVHSKERGGVKADIKQLLSKSWNKWWCLSVPAGGLFVPRYCSFNAATAGWIFVFVLLPLQQDQEDSSVLLTGCSTLNMAIVGWLWFQILFFTVLPNGNIVCVKFPCQCPNDRTCKILSSLSELSWGHQGEITVTAMIWSLWWKDSDSTHPVFKSGLALDNGIWPWHASRGTNSVRI